MPITIRPIAPDDLPAITEIFNHYVRASSAAYPDQEVGETFFRDRHQATAGYPFLVAHDGEQVVGFGSLRSSSLAPAPQDENESDRG